jgi:tetratricopeptide (TPR) repeat protein
MSEVNWSDVLGWGPTHLQELRFSGYTYLKEGKFDIARIFFEALVVVDPKNPFDLRMLGAIFLLLGDSSKALNFLDQSLTLEPTHFGARLNKAKALLYLGKIPEGLKAAGELVNCQEIDVANDAQALLLAYK